MLAHRSGTGNRPSGGGGRGSNSFYQQCSLRRAWELYAVRRLSMQIRQADRGYRRASLPGTSAVLECLASEAPS